MRVAIFSSSTGNKWALFIERHEKSLKALGIEITAVVLDDNTEKEVSRVRHAWKVAKRQALVARVPTLLSLARIVVYKYYSRCPEASKAVPICLTTQVKQVHV